MHKRKLYHSLTQRQKFSGWWFFVLGVVLLLVSAGALRANNQRMIELRQAVFIADEQDGDIEGALRALRKHVYGHMNTSLTASENPIRPPIQLRYEYERLVLSENARLNSSNESVYTDAQNFCETQISSGLSGSNRLDCIRQYVDEKGVSVEEVVIPDELYKFDFVSPTWSPDLAGISLVAAVLSLVVAATLWLSQFFLKRQLASHHH
jgi:hypothetical protein